jgi:hypothetical protein
MSTNSDATTISAHITQIANKASAMNMETSNAEKREQLHAEFVHGGGKRRALTATGMA